MRNRYAELPNSCFTCFVLNFMRVVVSGYRRRTPGVRLWRRASGCFVVYPHADRVDIRRRRDPRLKEGGQVAVCGGCRSLCGKPRSCGLSLTSFTGQYRRCVNSSHGVLPSHRKAKTTQNSLRSIYRPHHLLGVLVIVLGLQRVFRGDSQGNGDHPTGERSLSRDRRDLW